METRKKELDKDKTIDVDVLNLLTDEGLRAVPMETVSRIKFTNAKLDAELRRALALLASSHATDKKAVTLSFQGKGDRKARIGYVQETPVWKTSYRLELSDKKAPFLQGWAIVENMTEEDWSGVDLTLVSGRPISFNMDLYEPLYVSRPTVEMELYASLRPQVYGQDLAPGRWNSRRGVAENSITPRKNRYAPAKSPGGFGGGMGGFAYAAPASPPVVHFSVPEAGEPMDLRQGVQSLAQAGNVGELFRYAIATPVTLPRQQSAMLPIVNEGVKGEKVSIYNEGVQVKHPLNGLRLINTTKLHLMQGPITVFDDNVYAGDAKIEDLAPGSQRLLSYAMDLDTEVAPESKFMPEELLSVRLYKGTLIATNKWVRTRDYTVKNSGHKEKKVLIEYPLDPIWKLVAPEKPEEKTRDCYRFAVAAQPGEPAKLHVEEERTDRQQIALSNVDDGRGRLLPPRQGGRRQGEGGPGRDRQTQDRAEPGDPKALPVAAEDSRDQRGPEPHPAEHAAVGPGQRPLQTVHQEVQRPGRRDRAAADRHPGEPDTGERAAQSDRRLPDGTGSLVGNEATSPPGPPKGTQRVSGPCFRAAEGCSPIFAAKASVSRTTSIAPRKSGQSPATHPPGWRMIPAVSP